MSDRSGAPVIMWFRNDLRLADNPALWAAAESGRPVIVVFVRETGEGAPRNDGDAAAWWLHHSLTALASSLEKYRLPLVLRTGHPRDIIPSLVEETGAAAVHWNRRYESRGIDIDKIVKAALKDSGIEAVSHRGNLLYEPWTVSNKQGEPCRVFTPFWRTALDTAAPASPLPAPSKITAPGTVPDSEALTDWKLLPTAPDWAGGLRESWHPGEAGAIRQFEDFVERGLTGYADKRDRPDLPQTSRLSPHLRFGEISPNQIYSAIEHASSAGDIPERDARKFLSEIGWREFSHHLLYHFPTLPERNLQRRFDAFPWAEDNAGFDAWTKGLTGFPIVDAGMRELWQTGWMHNRVRMIVASFLVKNLLVPWQRGEEWFWDTLVDADHANNAASWQWVAGSGADAAPYFRIFNPLLQGEKFDPEGDYVSQYVPELAKLPKKFIHRPWDAPALVLKEAGVTLGETYPERIIDLAQTRERALRAFETIKDKSRDAA